jgi:hypothetical protein
VATISTGDSGESNVVDKKVVDKYTIYDKELFDTVLAANRDKPSAKDIEKLKQYLALNPDIALNLGDLSIQAELQIIENAITQQGMAICTGQFCNDMRFKLGYKTATAIERPLIEHVVLCWLRLYVMELTYEATMKSSKTLAQGRYWEDRLSINQKRYLRAVETLTKVRRLNINLQINIGDKQVIAR